MSEASYDNVKVVKEDAFLVEDENPETVEEKRLRMTKQIIKDYAKEEKTDFFATLAAKSTADTEVMAAEDDQLTKRMKMHMLEQKG